MKKIITLLSILFLIFNLKAQIIIQEIYGGSGGSGYTHNNDFIEIVNSGTSDVDISGYRVYYASQAGSTWTLVGGAVPATSILLPGSTFVFCGVQGGTGGLSCNCGVQNGTNISNSNGKVILIPNGDPAPTGACPTGVLVYGTSSNCSSNPSIPSPSNSQSVNFDGTNWVLATPTPVTTLPINILNFDLISFENKANISFSTSSETNNSHFNIEWSRDGKTFDVVGKVNGHGTTRDVQNYSFVHETPAVGVNYYRLTQVDYDGNSTSHPIKSITFTAGKRDFAIYPTITSTDLMIEFTTPVENGRILIYDMAGTMVKSFVLARGIDVLRSNVGDLVTGQYMAKYIDGDDVIIKKFNKI